MEPAMLLTTMILTFGLQQVGGDWKTELQFAGSTSYERLGWKAIPLGDLDHDQHSEVLVTAPYLDLGNQSLKGAVYVFSGASGAEVFRITSIDLQDTSLLGWQACSLGDIDQDNVPDFAFVGPGSPGSVPYSVLVYSGAQFNQYVRLYAPSGSLGFGFSGISGGTDLNGDDIPDLVVADDLYSGSLGFEGCVFVYDSTTWQLLWQVEGSVAWEQLGGNVGCVDDLNGDGFGDVLVYSNLAGSRGFIYVLSGLDGSELYTLQGPYSSAYLGIGGMVGVGDVDGDQLEDFAVDQNAGSTGLGHINIYSGVDGTLIRQIDAEVGGTSFPGPVVRVGDIDGDGFQEVATGAASFEQPHGGKGQAYVYSTRDGNMLGRIPAPPEAEVFSIDLGGGEDITGDGWPDLVVGDRSASVNGMTAAGKAYVYSFDPFLRASTTSVSSQLGGLVQFDIQFPTSEANKSYRLLTSTDLPGSTIVGDLAIPLKQSSLSWYLARNPQSWFTGTFGQLDANGYAVATAQVPPHRLAAYVDSTLKFAAVTLSPNNKPERSSASAFIEVEP